MADLYAVEGATSEYVDVHTNHPNSPGSDAIVEISPDRGLFLRLFNRIAKASRPGIPVYMKLRDSNGDHVPANTVAYWALQIQGMEEPTKVSGKKGNLSFYLSNDLTTQRDADNVDGSLFTLQEPETEGGNTVRHIDVRDIDTVYFKVDAAAEIDWNNSEFYVDTEAVEEASL